ncbi:MAG: hypothetical protein K9G62_04375 [Alphaproteobacteria bacterium]|nr:hypothetical protein [Alphaproteobacteria bacterium]
MRAFLFLTIFLFSAGLAGFADAQTSQSCDPLFMHALEKKAWKEGNREKEVAYNIMEGQASVLQYSCFSTHISQLAGPGAAWSNDWEGPIPINVTNMGDSLQKLVGGPMESYLGANFPGGVCQSMAGVWHESKCNNFDKDSFVDLSDNSGCGGGLGDLLIGGDEDPVKMYMPFIEGPCNETPAIKTGVIINQNANPPLEETICIPPGCTTSPGSTICG